MRILVLGAGSYQCELIQKAAQFGEVYAVSNNRADVGLAYTDKCEVISILDFDACYEYAKKESFSAIVSSGSQLAAYTLSQLNEVLGQRGFPFSFVKTMSDKFLMRQWLKDKLLSNIEFTVDRDRLHDSLEWIVKPRIASGSRGVERYTKKTDLITVAEESYFIKGWIAEAFIEGLPGSALFELNNGKAKRLLCTKKITNSNFVPVAHALTQLTEKHSVFLQQVADEMIQSFDLDSGFIDLDFIFSDDKIDIVDVGTRLSGNGLVEVYNELSGRNLYTQQLKMSLGIAVDELPTLTNENVGVMLYFSTENGVLKGYKSAFENIEVVSQKQFVKPGAKVYPLSEGKNQLGFFIFKTGKNAFDEISEIAKTSTISLE